jgi:serine/threonine-protein kinase RsbW
MPALDTGPFTQQELRLPADLARLTDARRFALQAAAQFGFDDAARQQITLAVNEAVANAMEHGSTGPTEQVALRAAEEEGGLAIYVRDSGSFAPRMLYEGSMPERGRGLAFMDLLMDHVDVRPTPTGTEVRLHRRLRS